MNYDQTNIAATYNRGREHGPAFLSQWMNVVASHVNGEVRNILDLGCGTGRFSQGLAAQFKAGVIGIDPSTKMLREALSRPADRRVVYASGAAESLPLPPDSVDVIFISMAFHHFVDPHAAARECLRVLRQHGRLCLRTASTEKISLYPYVPFFPASRILLEERLPSLAFQREVFEDASFHTLAIEVVTQQIASDYSEYADKLAVKADSILASLDDQQFDAGLHALRSMATTTACGPVTEPIDFMVFGKDSR